MPDRPRRIALAAQRSEESNHGREGPAASRDGFNERGLDLREQESIPILEVESPISILVHESYRLTALILEENDSAEVRENPAEAQAGAPSDAPLHRHRPDAKRRRIEPQLDTVSDPETAGSHEIDPTGVGDAPFGHEPSVFFFRHAERHIEFIDGKKPLTQRLQRYRRNTGLRRDASRPRATTKHGDGVQKQVDRQPDAGGDGVLAEQ